jgi:hypothetical protein
MSNLDDLWDDILSSDPARIRRAWENLTDDESLAVLEHLRRMKDEPGWQPAQRESAEIALRVVRDQPE